MTQIENDDDLEQLMSMLESDEDEETENISLPSKSNAEQNISSADLGLNLSDDENDKTKKSNGNDSQIDPLEMELRAMEERMRALKEQITKKKKLDSSSTLANSFTKFTDVQPSNKPSTSRTLESKEKASLCEKLKQTSEIHNGDTDSEDEEEKSNPFESKYSSLGKEIKRISRDPSASARHIQSDLKVMGSPSSSNNQARSWKELKGSLVSLKSGGQKDTDSNVAVDQYSGIRIINPLVSGSTLKDLMDGRRMIKMSTIHLHLRNNEIEGDWVTIGVVVYKGQPKKSQKGSQYAIWTLSDLRDCTNSVSFFLFGNAYQKLWKTAVGTVLGILNPQIMKDKPNEKSRSSLSLSINNQQKVLLMGTSKDLGWCKSKTKQNTQCVQFVNKATCEFCIYHIQKEYSKTSAKRQDVQSTFSRIDPRQQLQNKLIGKGQVFYGGNSYTSMDMPKPQARLIPANKNKDLAMLASLKTKLKADELLKEDKEKSFILKHMSDGEIAAVKEAVKANDSLSDMLLAPTVGARNLLKHKAKEDEKKETEATGGTPISISAKEFLKMTQKHIDNVTKKKPLSPIPKPNPQDSIISSNSLLMKKTKLATAFGAPKLGRGLGTGDDIEFDMSSPPRFTQKDVAKAKAAALLQSKGGIKEKPKNFVSSNDKRQDPEFQKKINKRLLEASDSNEENSPKRPHLENKSSSLSRSKLGNIDLNADKIAEMINKRSSHTNLVEDAENEAFENYCKNLEKKEMLEEKMCSIKEIKTTAVVCLKCKYIEQSASSLCKEENHPLKTVEAKKRFFECRRCKRRTTTLQKIPTKPCGNCNENSWVRCAMGKERTGKKSENEVLSLRGDELKSYGGVSDKVYLNI